MEIDAYVAGEPRRQESWSRHMYPNVSFVCAELQYGVHLRAAPKPCILIKPLGWCDGAKVTRETFLNSPRAYLSVDKSIRRPVVHGKGARSCEVNNPTAILLPAVCFAPGLFLRYGSELLFSIILEYRVPWHFFLPCLASKSQRDNLVFGVVLFVPAPFWFISLLLLFSAKSFVLHRGVFKATVFLVFSSWTFFWKWKELLMPHYGCDALQCPLKHKNIDVVSTAQKNKKFFVESFSVASGCNCAFTSGQNYRN